MLDEICVNLDFGGDKIGGISPTCSVEEITGGHRVTFVAVNGTFVFDVMDGQQSSEIDHREILHRDAEDQHPISAITGLEDVLDAKQDTITDLDNIRAGADAGATAYQKPSSGIPASDIADGVIPSTTSDLVNNSLAELVGLANGNALEVKGTKIYLVDDASSTESDKLSLERICQIILDDSSSYLIFIKHEGRFYPASTGIAVGGRLRIEYNFYSGYELRLGTIVYDPRANSVVTVTSSHGYAQPSDWEDEVYYYDAPPTVQAVDEKLDEKQNVIDDIENIRSGAAAGATALQAVPNTYRTASAQDEIDSGKQSTTITDTGGYFTTDTVEGALQEIGSMLDGTDTALDSILELIGGSTSTLDTTYNYTPEGGNA